SLKDPRIGWLRDLALDPDPHVQQVACYGLADRLSPRDAIDLFMGFAGKDNDVGLTGAAHGLWALGQNFSYKPSMKELSDAIAAAEYVLAHAAVRAGGKESSTAVNARQALTWFSSRTITWAPGERGDELTGEIYDREQPLSPRDYRVTKLVAQFQN